MRAVAILVITWAGVLAGLLEKLSEEAALRWHLWTQQHCGSFYLSVSHLCKEMSWHIYFDPIKKFRVWVEIVTALTPHPCSLSVTCRGCWHSACWFDSLTYSQIEDWARWNPGANPCYTLQLPTCGGFWSCSKWCHYYTEGEAQALISGHQKQSSLGPVRNWVKEKNLSIY